MKMKNIVGLMLVDAPHSALNMSGVESGGRAENITRTKTVRRGRDQYPYVSGQAVRYWWRNTLEEKFDWKLSPVIREEKIAYSKANPVQYDDDDVFGYMVAEKESGEPAVTRVAPFKNSPLISIVPQTPTMDWGVSARFEGDPVPYEVELYSTILRGIFSIDLRRVGVFTSIERSGHRNLTEEREKELKEQLEEANASKIKGSWIMQRETRKRRTQQVIQALPYLFGGATQTRHLTDVTPKFTILSVIMGGNHPFMNITGADEEGRPIVDTTAIEEVISDYEDIFLTPVYVGRRKGFMNNIDEELKELATNSSEVDVKYGSINTMVKEFSDRIPDFIPENQDIE